MIFAFPLAGYVFPLPVAIVVAIYVLGRVVHQIGYASGGYGKHAPGFALAMLAQAGALAGNQAPAIIGASQWLLVRIYGCK